LRAKVFESKAEKDQGERTDNLSDRPYYSINNRIRERERERDSHAHARDISADEKESEEKEIQIRVKAET
jgi:hypothetical protein